MYRSVVESGAPGESSHGCRTMAFLCMPRRRRDGAGTGGSVGEANVFQACIFSERGVREVSVGSERRTEPAADAPARDVCSRRHGEIAVVAKFLRTDAIRVGTANGEMQAA